MSGSVPRDTDLGSPRAPNFELGSEVVGPELSGEVIGGAEHAPQPLEQLVAADELAAGRDRAQLGHWATMTSDRQAFARLDPAQELRSLLLEGVL